MATKLDEFQYALLADDMARIAYKKLEFLDGIEHRIMITDVLSVDEKISILGCIFDTVKHIAYDLECNREARVQG